MPRVAGPRNELRIIGGLWRSRKLSFPAAEGLRPTPGRVRETVFNWLRDDVESARCLDLFAGSGALGFEAASRGAAKVVQVEFDARVAAALAANRTLLRAEQVTVMQADALHYLTGRAETFDLVFLDPPFRQAKVAKAAALLETGGWLAPCAKIYIEAEPEWALDDLPPGWALLRRGRAGDVAYYLYQRNILQSPP